MIFVRYFSGVIVWVSIIVYFVALMILAVFCKIKSKEYYELFIQKYILKVIQNKVLHRKIKQMLQIPRRVWKLFLIVYSPSGA